MDLNSLRIFVEVSRLGSFTAAAESLQLARTSVSNNVRRLEEQLGSRLLHRTTRSIRLTEVGHEVFAMAQQITLSANNIENLIQSRSEVPQGHLRIAAPPSFVTSFLGRWSMEFLQQHPKVSMEFVSNGEHADYFQDRIDFAFSIGALPESELIAKKLFSYRCGLFASPDLVKKYPTLEHPSELTPWPCVALTYEGRVYPWNFQENGKSFTVEPNTVVRFEDLTLVKDAAVMGVGIAHMGCQAAIADVDAGRLVPLLEEWWPPLEASYLLFAGHEHMALKNRIFIEFVENKIQEILPFIK